MDEMFRKFFKKHFFEIAQDAWNLEQMAKVPEIPDDLWRRSQMREIDRSLPWAMCYDIIDVMTLYWPDRMHERKDVIELCDQYKVPPEVRMGYYNHYGIKYDENLEAVSIGRSLKKAFGKVAGKIKSSFSHKAQKQSAPPAPG